MSDAAPPTMAPTSEAQVGRVVVQSWNMNVDAPTFQDKVDCVYSGTDRYLRLDASAVRTCTAKWKRIRHGSPILLSFGCSKAKQ